MVVHQSEEVFNEFRTTVASFGLRAQNEGGRALARPSTGSASRDLCLDCSRGERIKWLYSAPWAGSSLQLGKD